MMNKKGFAFVETIITVVVLMASLLVLYGSYNAILSDEKNRLYYDDPAFIYYTSYVKDFLEENGDLETIKKNYFNDKYVVALGTGFEGLFDNSEDYSSLEAIVENFNINQMVLVKNSIFNDCFDASDKCTNSINYLSAKMQKYINSISDMDYDYFLVIEYSVKLDDNKEYIKCTPMIDRNCKTFYASIGINNRSLASFIKKDYGGVQGNNGIYYHDATLDNGARDYSYRYAGKNPNNYICFDTTCTEDTLYRIIGVFNNQVKVIKATSIGSMKWDDNGYNTWSTSSLYTYLQGTYLTSISSFSSKIASSTWKVGGVLSLDVTPSTMYTNEMNSTRVGTDNKTEVTDTKIGLMYVSDYEFAASPTAWTLVGYNDDSTKDYRAATSINWLYLGSYEWTISRTSVGSIFAFYVFSTGRVGFSGVGSSSYAVRPAFYLESDVAYVSGQGSKIDPIRVG